MTNSQLNGLFRTHSKIINTATSLPATLILFFRPSLLAHPLRSTPQRFRFHEPKASTTAYMPSKDRNTWAGYTSLCKGERVPFFLVRKQSTYAMRLFPSQESRHAIRAQIQNRKKTNQRATLFLGEGSSYYHQPRTKPILNSRPKPLFTKTQGKNNKGRAKVGKKRKKGNLEIGKIKCLL